MVPAPQSTRPGEAPGQTVSIAMSFTITDAFVSQFSSNLRMLAQQKMSRFRGKVVEQEVTGESAFLDQLAATSARKVTSRHADSPLMNSQHLRRRVTTFGYDWGDLVDRLDKVALLNDPTSDYAQAGSAAMRRAQDDEIIAGAFAVAYSGHAGATALTWPNGNSESAPTTPAGTQVAVDSWAFGTGSGNIGLTISKLIEASVAIKAGEGEEDEEMYLALSQKDIGSLLATTEATSSDYNSVKALAAGTLNTFMGFTFVPTQRLLLNASGYRRLIAWRKSALGLGIGQDIQGQIAPRPDKKFSTYVYADQKIGATRLEEVKLAEIIVTA